MLLARMLQHDMCSPLSQQACAGITLKVACSSRSACWQYLGSVRQLQLHHSFLYCRSLLVLCCNVGSMFNSQQALLC